jgi:hypothetical protein
LFEGLDEEQNAVFGTSFQAWPPDVPSTIITNVIGQHCDGHNDFFSRSQIRHAWFLKELEKEYAQRPACAGYAQ